MKFSNIKMSSPSLPIVSQWLKLAFGVKRALGILLAFKINGSSGVLICNVAPYGAVRGQVTSPFSDWPAQKIRSANQTMSYDHASATCVVLCSLDNRSALMLWRIKRWFFDVPSNSTTRL